MKTVMIALDHKKFAAKMITDKLIAMGGVFNDGTSALSVAIDRETHAYVAVNARGEFYFSRFCCGKAVVGTNDVMTAGSFGELVC